MPSFMLVSQFEVFSQYMSIPKLANMSVCMHIILTRPILTSILTLQIRKSENSICNNLLNMHYNNKRQSYTIKIRITNKK